MYSDAVIAARQAQLDRQLGSTLPGGCLQRFPVADCHAMARVLAEAWDPEKKQQLRPLSVDEQAFVLNEQLLTKIDYPYWAQRYAWINYEGQALRPMFPLWESQTLILGEIARVEEQRWRSGHPDGLLFNILKGRQLGCSTLLQSLLAHRTTTHTQVRTMIGSDVPENSGSEGLFGMLELLVERLPWWLKPAEKFHKKDRHIMWANGSRVVVESGKSMKGGLQEDGGTKGSIGRSKTYSAVHLSELSSWERPDQITNSLLPAIPRTPRTLAGLESTALGRHNWWHQQWLITAEGLGRFFNIFIPWYAERSKYWLPTPPNWQPSDDTLAFARRAERNGPRFMHRSVSLSPEQLVWYETEKLAYTKRGELYKFLSEYPSEPEEAFQNSGRSIFSIETIDRIEQQTRPLLDVWTVRPHGELLADRELQIQELQQQQASAKAAREKHLLQVQGRPSGQPEPQIVREELPEAALEPAL